MFDFLKNMSQKEIIFIAVLLLVFFFGAKIVKMFAKTSGETVKDVRKIKDTFVEALEGTDSKSK